jgi:hypothetical protein
VLGCVSDAVGTGAGTGAASFERASVAPRNDATNESTTTATPIQINVARLTPAGAAAAGAGAGTFALGAPAGGFVIGGVPGVF